MITLNEHYLKLKSSYLFADIARRVEEFTAANPDRSVIRLGIGDVTLPLPEACIAAFQGAVAEQGAAESFRGYGPEQGYHFLREKIAAEDFRSRGAPVEPDEIFVSDGAKCDTGNFQELFAHDIRVAVPDPVYPVYVDTNVMAGRTGAAAGSRYGNLVYLEGTAANGFVPDLPAEKVDLIYLCFPNNPTGSVITKEQLGAWVEYARENRSLILFDAAYVSFIRDDSLPQSIFEIEGAREVAVEFRSFSKNAGFTGTRCGYTVVPRDCQVYDAKGQPYALHGLWNRRQTTKFNGVSYPVQRAAEAVYSERGRQEVRALTDYYLQNARLIRETMTGLGFECSGGENAPYIWIASDRDSWDFFDLLLNRAGVVTTPGAGFGQCGEGYIRISSFNSHENVVEALERIKANL